MGKPQVDIHNWYDSFLTWGNIPCPKCGDQETQIGLCFCVYMEMQMQPRCLSVNKCTQTLTVGVAQLWLCLCRSHAAVQPEVLVLCLSVGSDHLLSQVQREMNVINVITEGCSNSTEPVFLTQTQH